MINYKYSNKNVGLVLFNRGLLFFGDFGCVSLKDPLMVGNTVYRLDYSGYNSMKSLVMNNQQGSYRGFFSEVEIDGLGYYFNEVENYIRCKVGYSHYVDYLVIKQVRFMASMKDVILYSPSKELLGNYVKDLSTLYKFDLYKGKGIYLKGSVFKLKEGKKR